MYKIDVNMTIFKRYYHLYTFKSLYIQYL